MAEKKSSEEISMPVVDTHSTTTSTKSLVFNEKKKYSSGEILLVTIVDNMSMYILSQQLMLGHNNYIMVNVKFSANFWAVTDCKICLELKEKSTQTSPINSNTT